MSEEWWKERVAVLLKACETSWLAPEAERAYMDLKEATCPSAPSPVVLVDVSYLVSNGDTHWTLRYSDGTTSVVITPGVQQNESGFLGNVFRND